MKRKKWPWRRVTASKLARVKPTLSAPSLWKQAWCTYAWLLLLLGRLEYWFIALMYRIQTFLNMLVHSAQINQSDSIHHCNFQIKTENLNIFRAKIFGCILCCVKRNKIWKGSGIFEQVILVKFPMRILWRVAKKCSLLPCDGIH